MTQLTEASILLLEFKIRSQKLDWETTRAIQYLIHAIQDYESMNITCSRPWRVVDGRCRPVGTVLGRQLGQFIEINIMRPAKGGVSVTSIHLPLRGVHPYGLVAVVKWKERQRLERAGRIEPWAEGRF